MEETILSHMLNSQKTGIRIQYYTLWRVKIELFAEDSFIFKDTNPLDRNGRCSVHFILLPFYFILRTGPIGYIFN